MNHKPCLNCGRSVYEHYCGHCGQKISTKRLDWHYLWHDIPHSVLHLDKGFWPTLLGMLSKPGVVIREYLDGKRAKYFRPLTYLLILGTIAGIIYLKVPFYQDMANDAESTEFMTVYQELNSKYFNLFTSALLPLQALFLWLFFRRERNFVEITTSLFFIAGTTSLVSVLMLFYYVQPSKEMIIGLGLISFLFSAFYQTWSIASMFVSKKIISRIVISLFSVIITAAVSSIVAFMIALFYLMIIKGVDHVNLNIGT
jgi:Protein of unknown function (DUF3667)